MDRFRKDDPDAPRLAAAILWDEVGPAYTMETFIRGAAAVLNHIEPDTIEQPRLPTRSDVERKLEWIGLTGHEAATAAKAFVSEEWATEDPEPEVDPAPALLNRFEAMVRLLGPEEMTPTATRQFQAVIAEERERVSGRVQVTP